MASIFSDFAKEMSQNIKASGERNVGRSLVGKDGSIAQSAYRAAKTAYRGADSTQRALGGAALGAGAIAAVGVGASVSEDHPAIGVIGTAALVGIAAFRPGMAKGVEKEMAAGIVKRTGAVPERYTNMMESAAGRQQGEVPQRYTDLMENPALKRQQGDVPKKYRDSMEAPGFRQQGEVPERYTNMMELPEG